jgi:hypothetical protein
LSDNFDYLFSRSWTDHRVKLDILLQPLKIDKRQASRHNQFLVSSQSFARVNNAILGWSFYSARVVDNHISILHRVY